eukprot:m.275229 g.275229  ORF g.275229 m.275229 type:complete len:81 (+) comp11092_c0_seq1:960-1202(+)
MAPLKMFAYFPIKEHLRVLARDPEFMDLLVQSFDKRDDAGTPSDSDGDHRFDNVWTGSLWQSHTVPGVEEEARHEAEPLG